MIFRIGDRVSDSDLDIDLGTVKTVLGTEKVSIRWDDGQVSTHPIADLRKVDAEYMQPLNDKLAGFEDQTSFKSGDRVLLGDGNEGTVLSKVERVGFESYRVKITQSDDEEQIGRTVAATPSGMRKLSGRCVKIGDLLVECEVADTPDKQTQGLQTKTSLEDGQGMLFPYSPPKTVSFHTGSVQFPFDMVAIRDGKISRIVSDIQPGTPGFWMFKKVEAVLEVPGGFCERNQIKEGDPVSHIAERQTYDVLRSITEADKEVESQHVPSYIDLPMGEQAHITGPSDARVYLSRAFSKGMTTPAQVAQDLIDAWFWNNPKGLFPETSEWPRIMMQPDYRMIWLRPIDEANNNRWIPLYTSHIEYYQEAWKDLILSEIAKENRKWSRKQSQTRDWSHFIDEKFEQEESIPTGPKREPGDKRKTPPDQSFRDRQSPAEFLPDEPRQEQEFGYSPLKETKVPMRPSAKLLRLSQLILELDPTMFFDTFEMFQSTPVGQAALKLAEAYDSDTNDKDIQKVWRQVSGSLDYWSKDAIVHSLVDIGYDKAIDLLKVGLAKDFEVGNKVTLVPRTGDAFEGIRKDTEGEVVGVQDEMIGVKFEDYPIVKWIDSLDLSVQPEEKNQQGFGFNY